MKDTSFGDRLRRLRGDMNQGELSRLSGLDQTTISRYEIGDRTPSIRHVEKLAAALGIAPWDLLWEDGLLPAIYKTRFSSVRLAGFVRAGVPVMSEELHEEVVVPIECPEDCYALHVVGDSMEGAHIVDGDTIIVHAQDHAENGQMAVVAVNGCQTLKTFYQRKDHVELVPANHRMTPIQVPSDQVVVKGVVVYVTRSLRR